MSIFFITWQFGWLNLTLQCPIRVKHKISHAYNLLSGLGVIYCDRNRKSWFLSSIYWLFFSNIGYGRSLLFRSSDNL